MLSLRKREHSCQFREGKILSDKDDDFTIIVQGIGIDKARPQKGAIRFYEGLSRDPARRKKLKLKSWKKNQVNKGDTDKKERNSTPKWKKERNSAPKRNLRCLI